MNCIIIKGRLTSDPELKHTQNDTPVCSVNVAVDRPYSKEKETDFFTVVFWRQAAEFVCKYFSKKFWFRARCRAASMRTKRATTVLHGRSRLTAWSSAEARARTATAAMRLRPRRPAATRRTAPGKILLPPETVTMGTTASFRSKEC